MSSRMAMMIGRIAQERKVRSLKKRRRPLRTSLLSLSLRARKLFCKINRPFLTTALQPPKEHQSFIKIMTLTPLLNLKNNQTHMQLFISKMNSRAKNKLLRPSVNKKSNYQFWFLSLRRSFFRAVRLWKNVSVSRWLSREKCSCSSGCRRRKRSSCWKRRRRKMRICYW